ncbi:YczE/YyaS/YitT family protein [Salinicoccus halitifaciens]|uniref:Membrane protein YczE n=1 Tax=Salinicoccus halitifaciens TaxID=1073415 RepID=A0ABV2EA69_9STAP|nr:YitT family protein [Salinicoccus halitifaciens]MCD2138448.1 YitT family protein [Salinicoccus halitifaciens]
MRNSIFKRWLFFVGGMIILSLGVALTIKGRMYGLGPWDVFHYGLWDTFGLTIGSWSIIVGAVIVLFTAVALKRLPKLGVYINMFTIGIFIDVFNFLLPEVEGWVMHGIAFTAGVIVMAFGIAFYITPNLGAGPRDTLMLFFIEKFNMKLSSARNLMEAFALVGGFLLGGPVFIGSFLIVFLLGKLIENFLPVTRRLLVKFIGHDHPDIIKVI